MKDKLIPILEILVSAFNQIISELKSQENEEETDPYSADRKTFEEAGF